jgi:hypothetical protein
MGGSTPVPSSEEVPIGQIYIDKGNERKPVTMKGPWLDKPEIPDSIEGRKRALLQGLAVAALRSQVKYGDDERFRREAKGVLPVVAQGLANQDIAMALERIDTEAESSQASSKKLSYPCGQGDKKRARGFGRKSFYYCFQEGEMLVWGKKRTPGHLRCQKVPEVCERDPAKAPLQASFCYCGVGG